MTLPSWMSRPCLPTTQRVLVSVLGGYAFCSASVALLTVCLIRAGVQRSEAVICTAMLGFVLYLAVLIWAFSVRGLPKLWLGTVGGTAMLHGLLAWSR